MKQSLALLGATALLVFVGSVDAQAPTDPVSIAFQEAILAGDLAAMRVFLEYFEDTRVLAAAFRFASEQRDALLTPSQNRFNDPDVVSVRGLAKAMLDLRNAEKLAEVIIFAIENPDGTIPVNRTQLAIDISSAYSNQTLIEEVLYTDPNLPDEEGRRKLLAVGTPVDSFYCASCYKKSLCRKTAYWCQ